MTWRILVDWLPDNDESRPVHLAHGRICHLEHAEGSPTSDMHAYFETDIPKGWGLLADSDDTHNLVASVVFKDYPRFTGSVWDLISTALLEAGLGPSELEEANGVHRSG